MKILVLIKQVPDSQKVKVDPETGLLLRQGVGSQTNPYDLYAIETAVRIRNLVGGTVTAISMGPPNAKVALKEAFALGVDEAYLLSDRKFGGADVLATSFTLAQGILLAAPDYDLIVCGKQTTDGDTAQVGPAISEHLNIPVVNWVKEIVKVTNETIQLRQEFENNELVSEVHFPCLITVEKDIYQPSLPSYKLKKATKEKEVKVLTFADMQVNDEKRYGLNGSATQVERIFEPDHQTVQQQYKNGDLSSTLYEKLVELKYVTRGQK